MILFFSPLVGIILLVPLLGIILLVPLLGTILLMRLVGIILLVPLVGIIGSESITRSEEVKMYSPCLCTDAMFWHTFPFWPLTMIPL